MSDALLLAVRHNCWANLELIAFVRALPADQAAWTLPGAVYGSIHQCLSHIVTAEQSYLWRLTGDEQPAPVPYESPLPLAELEAREKSVAERCEKLLASPFDTARTTQPPGRRSATAGVVIAQLVHHGSDHRAHVGSILGAHGVQPPNLDVWAYGVAIGEVGPQP